jgi:hypothetical protein
VRRARLRGLQYLAKHQVANNDLVRAEGRPQSSHAGRIASVQEIDRDTAVDDNQRVRRPLRLRAEFPRQRNLPNEALTSCCRRNLTISRSASSTVCFLVA